MAIQGLRDSNNFVTDQRPKNWREGILLLEPNGTAPLFALTSVMKTKTTDDPEFNWWDKIQPSQRLALVTDGTGNLATGDTTLTLTSGASQLKDGHLLYLEESSEIVLVNGDPSSETSVNVIRGYAGTSVAAITATGPQVNNNLFVVGSAYEEGSAAPTGINYDPTKRTNFTQIFRNNLEATRTAMKTRLRTGDAVREARRECLELHSMEIERALWFGGKSETVRNGKPLRTTEGVVSQIATANIKDWAGADKSLEDLEDELKNAFAFGSSEKMAFMGNTAILTIQRIARRNSSYQFMQGQKEFGMNVTRLTTPFGDLVMKTHPLWNRLTGGAVGGTTDIFLAIDSWMIILDMKELVYRPFQGDDTRWIPDQQENGLDGLKAGYLTEAGLELHHPTAHYVIKGITSAVSDS